VRAEGEGVRGIGKRGGGGLESGVAGLEGWWLDKSGSNEETIANGKGS